MVLTFVFPSVDLASGDATGFAGEDFGSIDGLVTGDAAGLTVATGVGVAGIGFGVSAFGPQAPNRTVLTAKANENIIVLLIFSSLSIWTRTQTVRKLTSTQPE